MYPVSGVERVEIETFKDVVRAAYEVLKAEGRTRNYKLLQPVLEWCDEEPLDEILERHKIMAGDLYSTRDNLERIITFIGIIAMHLSESDFDLQDRLINIVEMAETLKIRMHYGIREELFDLVLRLDNVARVRARMMYNAGYHTVTQVRKENPYVLNRKTGLGFNLCKKIIGKN